MTQGATHSDFDPVEVINPAGEGVAVILCEHASNSFPAAFGSLGLSDADQISHAAWDPGARAVSLLLSQALNAPVIASTVSRLIYDCNRPPEADSAMPTRSEQIHVPGNENLTEAQRQTRVDQVYTPFCDEVAQVLRDRAQRNLPTALITMHSFTPVYFDQPRAVEIGVLHDRDTRLADAMLQCAPLLPHRRIERNQPYGPQDGVTHTLKKHGLNNDLPNVMIEVRNDLLTTEADQRAIADELLTLIRPALTALGLIKLGQAHV